MLGDKARREAMQRELATIVEKLGGAGASQRAAELIAREIG